MYKHCFSLREVANGVVDEKGRFYPYQEALLTPSPTATQNPTNPNVRFFIKSVLMVCRAAAGDATTFVYFRGYTDGIVSILAQLAVVPGVAASYHQEWNLGMMIDEGMPISSTVDAAVTFVRVRVIYAEVPNYE